MCWFIGFLFMIFGVGGGITLLMALVAQSSQKRLKKPPTQRRLPSKADVDRLTVEQAAEFVLRAWKSYQAGGISRENLRKRLGRVADVPLLATRSSVLDDEACSCCRNLDGLTTLVYSEEYKKSAPPNGCDSERDCCCMFLYIMADNEEEATPRLLDAVLENGVVYESDYYG